MVGLTNYTTKAHICRAAIEAVCFQSKEVGYYKASTVGEIIIERSSICHLCQTRRLVLIAKYDILLAELGCHEARLRQNPDLKPLLSVCVGGRMTKNKFMLQLQADILGINLGGTSCVTFYIGP